MSKVEPISDEAASAARAARADRRLLLIVHSYYDEDPRVRRQAEALARAGRPVTVIGLRRPEDPVENELAGVRVLRVDVQRHQGAGLPVYLAEYLAFGASAAAIAWREHRRKRVALVQVASLPDFLAFAALPLRLAGVPLLLDLHEAMPELFRSRFPRAANPVVQWALRVQERLSIQFSTLTLSVNDAMRDRLLRLGVAPDKVVVVPNVPALSRFDPTAHPARAFAEDGTVRLLYGGALTPIYEVDVAMRALGILHRTRPDLRLRLDLYGRGDSEEALKALSVDEGVDGIVEFHGRVPLDAMPAVIAASDVGLAPTRRDPFTDLSLSTKVYEYSAMGKVTVASNLPLVERTFGRDSVLTYEAGNPEAMAGAIARAIDDGPAREASIAAVHAAVHAATWEIESEKYIALVDRLARTRRRIRRSGSG